MFRERQRTLGFLWLFDFVSNLSLLCRFLRLLAIVLPLALSSFADSHHSRHRLHPYQSTLSSLCILRVRKLCNKCIWIWGFKFAYATHKEWWGMVCGQTGNRHHRHIFDEAKCNRKQIIRCVHYIAGKIIDIQSLHRDVGKRSNSAKDNEKK